MPEITEGLYKVTLVQEYRSQVVQNVFFYEHTLGTDDQQEECAEAFDEDILPQLKLIQHSTLLYTAIRVANPTGDLADFVLTPTTPDGVQTGDPLSSFTACSFLLSRTTKETRNGQKRFAGMTEQNADTQRWETTFQAALDTFAPFLSAQISIVGALFNPVIARQNLITPTIWTVNPVASAQARSTITTQVSRKTPIT